MSLQKVASEQIYLFFESFHMPMFGKFSISSFRISKWSLPQYLQLFHPKLVLWNNHTWRVKVRSHCDGNGNGNGDSIFFPSWMGLVQTNKGVHMETDSNGNGIFVKWVVDTFCDGNGNGKKQCQIHATFPLPLPSVTMWAPLFVCTEPIHDGIVSIAIENPLGMNRWATKSLPLPSQCERTLTNKNDRKPNFQVVVIYMYGNVVNEQTRLQTSVCSLARLQNEKGTLHSSPSEMCHTDFSRGRQPNGIL